MVIFAKRVSNQWPSSDFSSDDVTAGRPGIACDLHMNGRFTWLGPGEFAEETEKNFSIGATHRL
jgi:hypothetical protein